MRTSGVFVGLVIALQATLCHAQRELKEIPDPDPELERKTFILPEGMEVNLYASDPLIAKPIQMNFDAEGRLWVASSSIYPHILPGKDANDRILVIEDKNRDGTADSTTVFAEGLLIPTGVVPGDGGAYVANSTEMLHFQDLNGDLKADKKSIILSGFGTEDTHHIIHTFRWGHDGQLYFNQSIYIHSHVETPSGVKRLLGGGVWEFRPETLELDVFFRGLVNSWGHHFDRWGQSFATDGAGGEGINYVVPGAAYFTAVGFNRIVQGLNPGSPKHCGLEIVSSRHFPDDWQGNAITNDFRGHRVCRFVLSEDGSGFASREQVEVIKSNHVAFRPIDVKVGPDGALYIADWYNPIIQHGEVDFRDERRDHVHGRIWRVTFKDRPLVPHPKIVGEPVKKLLEMLREPEEFTRLHAKLELKKHGAAALPALEGWIAGLDPADPDYEHLRLEGLWCYQTLNQANAKLVRSILESPEPRSRAAGVRVLKHWLKRIPKSDEWLKPLVTDDHPRVRMEAIRALSNVSRSDSVEIALRALDLPMDRFLDYALWLTARELQGVWIPELSKGKLDFDGNSRHLAFALQAAESPQIVPALLNVWTEGRNLAVASMIADLGNPDELRPLFDEAIRSNSTDLLEYLLRAATARNVKPAGDLASTMTLLSQKETRSLGVRLLGAWKVQAAVSELGVLATAAETDPEIRLEALEALSHLEGIEAIQKTLDSELPAEIRIQALAALVKVDPAKAAPVAVEKLPSLAVSANPESVIAAFVASKEGPAILQNALQGKSWPSDLGKVAVRTCRKTARDLTALISAIQAASQITPGPTMLKPEELEALVTEVREKGDPTAGEALYRDQTLGCMKCHAIAGAGGKVGPDLVSIGASAQIDYLIHSLIEPGKQIKENYNSTVVTLDDGLTVSGIRVSESPQQLVLRDVEDREVVIPITRIEERADGGSLMPNALTDDLTRAELVNLVRFLSELGKVGGAFVVGKERVVRRFEMFQPVAEFQDQPVPIENPIELIQGDKRSVFVPVYARVSGGLEQEDLAYFSFSKGPQKYTLLQFNLDVSTPGKVRLKLSNKGTKIWLDQKEADPNTLGLSAGPHAVSLLIPIGDPIRVEIDESIDPGVQFQIRSGK